MRSYLERLIILKYVSFKSFHLSCEKQIVEAKTYFLDQSYITAAKNQRIGLCRFKSLELRVGKTKSRQVTWIPSCLQLNSAEFQLHNSQLNEEWIANHKFQTFRTGFLPLCSLFISLDYLSHKCPKQLLVTSYTGREVTYSAPWAKELVLLLFGSGSRYGRVRKTLCEDYTPVQESH